LSSSYIGSRNTQPGDGDHSFARELPPYSIHDIHLGKSWSISKGEVGLRFSIYNLLNTSYQAIRSRPMPMRNYALTIRLEI
jgi:outer membrane receptor protein involved in Fe transport